MGWSRGEFDRELEAIEAKVIELLGMVVEDLTVATRALLTVLRVVPELERSHDLVAHIASQASFIRGGDLPPGVTGLARRMADLVSVMWRQAADAWYERDRSVAAALGRHRDEAERLHAALTAEIAAGRMTVLVTMEMALVARDYDRLGAHALNIARRVAYLAGRASGPPAGH